MMGFGATRRNRGIGLRATALAFVVLLSGCDVLGPGVATEDLTSPCPDGSEPSARTLGVVSKQVNIRTGPGTGFERVIDGPRSRENGAVEYAVLGANYTVLEECRKGAWSRIWVTEPEQLRATHHGWVANRLLKEVRSTAGQRRRLGYGSS